MSGRTGAALALGALATAFVAALAVTTPWPAFDRPVPGGPVAIRVAGDFTPGEVARAEDYRSGVRPPAYLSLGAGLAAALLLGFTPLGARLIDAAVSPLPGSLAGWWWVRVFVGALAVSLVIRAVALPFDARAEAVSRQYGLSTRSWGGWALDVARGWGLSAVLLVGVLLGLFWLVRRFPDGWWLPAAAGGAVLVFVLSFAYPLVVEPVFNRFQPLVAGELRTDLLDLAERDGVPVSEVLVADASRRTSTLNAYVSGFGPTRRIVVYDTLLGEATDAEIELIVAHELGHAERRDVLRGTLLGALGIAAGSCVLYLLLQWAPLLRRAGVSSLADPRALALVLALVTVLTTLSGPLQLLVSRRVETRADVHALELTRDPATFAAMQRRLAVANLSDPTPPALLFALFASHPTAPMRIATAREWARISGVPEPGPLVPAAR